MDPLSLTASALTIVAAIDQSVKCVRKLSAIRKAPSELSALLVEVSDLHAVLLLVAAVYEEEEKHSKQQPIKGSQSTAGSELKHQIQANLERHSERAALALDDLNRIACDYSSNLQSGKRIKGGLAAFSWIQSGRKKALKLREQLQEIRLNIVATLGAKTSATIGRVEQTLAEFQSRGVVSSSQTVNNINLAVDTTPRIPALTANSESSDPSQQLPCRPSRHHCPQEAIAAMTKKQLGEAYATATVPVTGQRAPSGTIAAAVATALHNSCVAWCNCSCHSRGHLRSLPVLDPVFGNISVVYGGILSAARPCNEYSCRRRSDKMLKLKYRPPAWLYVHLFQLSMVMTPLYGLKLDLKLPRTVGWDALIWSLAMDGDVEGVQGLFAQAVASPWDVNPIGGSMLHYAADHRKFDLCRLLLTNGADPQHEDDCRRNPALMAWDHVLSNSLSAEQEYIVGSLFCNSDYLETQGFTTLHKTVIGLVHRELGVELRCSISDIDAQDANGRTPLFWATRRGDVDAVQLLLDYGANVSIADNQGYMPIHEASTVACARVLLSKSVQVMSRNTWGRTALHQACERGEDAALLDVLISAGADVDATDATGETPLHTTIVHERTGHPRTEHAARLMRAGADSSITNLSGDSPLRFAMMFGTHEILKDMVKYHTDFSDVKHIFGHTFAHSIARSADVQTLQCLQNAKGLVLDLEALDKSGKTALDYVQQRSEDPTLVAAFDQLVRATTRASTDTQRVGENLEIGAVKVEPVVSMIELNEAAVSIEDVGDSNSVIYHDAMEDLGTTLSSDASVEVAAA